jgi:hypothetical protein
VLVCSSGVSAAWTGLEESRAGAGTGASAVADLAGAQAHDRFAAWIGARQGQFARTLANIDVMMSQDQGFRFQNGVGIAGGVGTERGQIGLS